MVVQRDLATNDRTFRLRCALLKRPGSRIAGICTCSASAPNKPKASSVYKPSIVPQREASSLQNCANDNSPSSPLALEWNDYRIAAIRTRNSRNNDCRHRRTATALLVYANRAMPHCRWGCFTENSLDPSTKPGPREYRLRYTVSMRASRVGGFVSTLKRSADFVTSSPGGSPVSFEIARDRTPVIAAKQVANFVTSRSPTVPWVTTASPRSE